MRKAYKLLGLITTPASLLIAPEFASAPELSIGLIADTHMPGTIAELWPQVHAAFSNVDCILHAGDLHVSAVIDELEGLAPTFVCAGNGDLDVRHPKLRDHWLGSLAGVQVAMVHKFPTPRRADEHRLQRKVQQVFSDADPGVVIYGHTHLAEVHSVAGRTYINPGSPTLPNNQSTRHGTVGFLHISNRGISVELHQIEAHGLSLIQSHSVPT